MSEQNQRSKGYGREATRELVAKLLESSVPTLFGSMLAALATCSILLPDSNSNQLLFWCSIVVLISIVRLAPVWRWRKSLNVDNARHIARLYSTGAFFAGLSWSFVLYFYSPDNPYLSQLIVLVLLASLPAAGLANNSHWLPAFYLFSLPLWGASIGWAIMYGEDKRIQFCLIIFAYIGLIAVAANRNGGTVKQLILEGYRNKELVREVREVNDRLNMLAYEDPLTRLANRRQFEENAIEAMNLLNDMHISEIVLMMIDVDNFKGINDKMGHDAGDKLLKEISRRMMEMSRHSEVIVQGRMNTARIGGDEFAILYYLDKSGAGLNVGSIAQRILNAMAEAISFKDEVFWPSVSVGVAMAPSQAADFSELRRLADQAMYRAKSQGGNRVCIHGQ